MNRNRKILTVPRPNTLVERERRQKRTQEYVARRRDERRSTTKGSSKSTWVKSSRP